ncbi:winged helix-turn-helix transcriptional regulator [Umezawaea endophytica]|uniref:Helix-turn-helix transcriptional regulator n=1 Tax=Umezawaea endophytica TaxID=1654476 RepID=A0A9X2VJ45_9PSEU|nr:helix-turn-helix domain-containing protein [Umezawaea endophytica]MCS7476063.1 helix-turn-helix transcriptional regulator [Umezawaea endophytica]
MCPPAMTLSTPVPLAEHRACPVTDVLNRVGDRWSVVVIVLLGGKPFRFNELHRSIEGISQRMLTRTLRGLEHEGLVSREVFPTNPPGVEYALTALGESLLVPLSALARWAVEHHGELAAKP